jgi:hypothetical protein
MGMLQRIKDFLDIGEPQFGDAFMRQQSIMADLWASRIDREIISEIAVHGAVKKLIKNPVAYFGIFSYLDENGYVQCQMVKNEHVWRKDSPMILDTVKVNPGPDIEVKDYD